MSALHPTTRRRLLNLPQVPSVWEGDRRSLTEAGSPTDAELDGDCVLWVDGSEGAVRAIDIVASEDGPEAVVRTLLRAMEKPHSQMRPARPRKIVVCNREIQFFLRGALQGLEIAIDYAPGLPLIDELFRSFGDDCDGHPPTLPPEFASLLRQVAADLWHTAPWEFLADSDILAVEIDRWEVGTLYACVMGMLGREYGLLLYRSLNSLLDFRRAVLCQQSLSELEKAFLQQDCWFLNFEPVEAAASPAIAAVGSDLQTDAMEPSFGSVHPFEGMRPYLGPEEASAVYVALQALKEFTHGCRRELSADPIEKLIESYHIPVAAEATAVVATVSTLPELATEFLHILAEADAVELTGEGVSQPHSSLPPSASVPQIRDNLVPDDALVSLKVVPWEAIVRLRDNPKKHYHGRSIDTDGEPLPVVVVQTSRPKAKDLIARLENAGGLDGIGFNPGVDPLARTTYDLGLLRLADGSLQLLAEFLADKQGAHLQAKQAWYDRGRRVAGACALIVASGATGGARGNPSLRDMMAVFEARVLQSEDFGLGTLQLMPRLDIDSECE